MPSAHHPLPILAKEGSWQLYPAVLRSKHRVRKRKHVRAPYLIRPESILLPEGEGLRWFLVAQAGKAKLKRYLMNLYQQATYLRSVHHLHQLPEDEGIEVAFLGRSNSGKSSAINAITGHKGLARTSKTPGRTQQLIFFKLDDQRRLVDLPGYGYAKVPQAIKQHWYTTLANYLQVRHSLRGIVLMMDIRHPLTDFDQQILTWGQSTKRPVHILLTKADKFSYGKARTIWQQVQNQCLAPEISIQLFSALKGIGVEEARTRLNEWLAVNLI